MVNRVYVHRSAFFHLRSIPALKCSYLDSHTLYSFRVLIGATRTKVGCDQKRFFHALWSPSCFATSLLLIRKKFSVRRAMCRQAIGEQLLEQIRIVPLCNVWVTPVMRRSSVSPKGAQIERRGGYVLDSVDEGDLPRR